MTDRKKRTIIDWKPAYTKVIDHTLWLMCQTVDSDNVILIKRKYLELATSLVDMIKSRDIKAAESAIDNYVLAIKCDNLDTTDLEKACNTLIDLFKEVGNESKNS